MTEIQNRGTLNWHSNVRQAILDPVWDFDHLNLDIVSSFVFRIFGVTTLVKKSTLTAKTEQKLFKPINPKVQPFP
jgi:hypothetical protein